MGVGESRFSLAGPSRQRSYTACSRLNSLGYHGIYHNTLTMLYSCFGCLVTRATSTERCPCALYPVTRLCGEWVQQELPTRGRRCGHFCSLCWCQPGCKPSTSAASKPTCRWGSRGRLCCQTLWSVSAGQESGADVHVRGCRAIALHKPGDGVPQTFADAW